MKFKLKAELGHDEKRIDTSDENSDDVESKDEENKELKKFKEFNYSSGIDTESDSGEDKVDAKGKLEKAY